MIRKAADSLGRRCVFIASGDLAHCQKADGPYGYRPEGPAYDEKIMEVMGRGAFSELTDFDEDLLDRSMETALSYGLKPTTERLVKLYEEVIASKRAKE